MGVCQPSSLETPIDGGAVDCGVEIPVATLSGLACPARCEPILVAGAMTTSAHHPPFPSGRTQLRERPHGPSHAQEPRFHRTGAATRTLPTSSERRIGVGLLGTRSRARHSTNFPGEAMFSHPRLVFTSICTLAIVACSPRVLQPGLEDAGGISDASAGPPDAPEDLGVSDRDPVLGCGGNAGALMLKTPCLLGRSPTFELDCQFDDAEVLKVLLPFSFPNGLTPLNPNSTTGTGLTWFDADVLPGTSRIVGGVTYALIQFRGFIAFDNFDLPHQSFTGMFSHADVTWKAEDGTTIVCSFDNGRFSAIPGNFQ